MFAYCLNNPVNRTDTTGTISLWYFLIVDSDMGFIHRAVVDHIGENYWGIRTEYILDNFGRADVGRGTTHAPPYRTSIHHCYLCATAPLLHKYFE